MGTGNWTEFGFSAKTACTFNLQATILNNIQSRKKGAKGSEKLQTAWVESGEELAQIYKDKCSKAEIVREK